MSVQADNTMFMVLTVFLAAAVIEDLARQRISNVLTFSAALLALTLHVHAAGFSGMLNGLGGLAVGLGVFLPFFLMGGMGAGDVKAMAAAGAFLAPWPSLLAAGLSLVAGGVLGLAVLIWRGGFISRSLLFRVPMAKRRSAVVPAGMMAQRFPYALAIATGTLSAVYWLGSR